MRKVETGDLRVGRRKIRTDFPVESLMHFPTVNFGTFQRVDLINSRRKW